MKTTGSPTTTTLLLFNKPFQVLCQFSDETGRATLADYIDLPGVYAAGRLDRDSEGLLLLTDDGRLQHRISDPRYKLPKRYLVQVEGEPADDALAALRRGVALKDGVSAKAQVEKATPPDSLWPRDPPVRFRAAIPTSWLWVTLTEGRNRQVRRMTAAVGYPTLRLIRTDIGKLSVWNLSPGETAQVDAAVLFGSHSGNN